MAKIDAGVEAPLGIKYPAIKSRFLVKFIEVKTGEELSILPIRIVRARDHNNTLALTVELDCELLSVKDIYKLKRNAKDYVMLLCVMLGDSPGSAFVYENINVANDPLGDITWDYASSNTQQVEVNVAYKNRLIITTDATETLLGMLKTPA